LLGDVAANTKPPEIIEERFKELVISHRQAKIFQVFFELGTSDSITSSETTELLNRENGLLNLSPKIVLIFSAILYVGMGAEIEFLFDTAKAG
jgi:hypothetical protein